MPYDIIGDSNLIGDAVDELLKGAGDDEGVQGYGAEIIGAMQRAKVRNTAPTRLQRLALGIGITSVAATSSAVVTVTPQVPFKLERFISQSTGLTVNDVKVGTNSQFVGAGSIPVEIFARDAIGVGLKGDTAVPGVDIALYVSNPSGGALTLSGAYLGLAAT
jgi:hypothetical protein